MSISKRMLRDGTTVYDVREYVGFTLDGKRDNGIVIGTYEAMGPLLAALRDYARMDGGFLSWVRAMHRH